MIVKGLGTTVSGLGSPPGSGPEPRPANRTVPRITDGKLTAPDPSARITQRRLSGPTVPTPGDPGPVGRPGRVARPASGSSVSLRSPVPFTFTIQISVAPPAGSAAEGEPVSVRRPGRLRGIDMSRVTWMAHPCGGTSQRSMPLRSATDLAVRRCSQVLAGSHPGCIGGALARPKGHHRLTVCGELGCDRGAVGRALALVDEQLAGRQPGEELERDPGARPCRSRTDCQVPGHASVGRLRVVEAGDLEDTVSREVDDLLVVLRRTLNSSTFSFSGVNWRRLVPSGLAYVDL